MGKLVDSETPPNSALQGLRLDRDEAIDGCIVVQHAHATEMIQA